jgi:hypothetical protein
MPRLSSGAAWDVISHWRRDRLVAVNATREARQDRCLHRMGPPACWLSSITRSPRSRRRRASRRSDPGAELSEQGARGAPATSLTPKVAAVAHVLSRAALMGLFGELASPAKRPTIGLHERPIVGGPLI